MPRSLSEVLHDLRHPDRRIEQKEKPVVVQNLVDENEPKNGQNVELYVKHDKRSSDSLVSLCEDMLILILPAD